MFEGLIQSGENPKEVHFPIEDKRYGYYQSVLSSNRKGEKIGGLAINSPDVSSIPEQKEEGVGMQGMMLNTTNPLQQNDLIDSNNFLSVSPQKQFSNTKLSAPRPKEPVMNLSGEEPSSMLEGNDEDLTIDNPMEIDQEALEDDDPELLEEMDQRQEEIIEKFMEISYTIKHDATEAVMQDASLDEDERDQKKREVSKKCDAKKRAALKQLKQKLNEVITDETLHMSARLEKLYDENEI